MNKEAAISRETAALGRQLGFAEADLPVFQQALTHPAFFEGGKHPQAGDNQRLEFLGDAVLDLIAGEYLYGIYPQAPEGQLSKMRAFIVCEASLAKTARRLGIDKALRLGRGSDASGDRHRPSVLADAFEAVIGAVFLCYGYQAAQTLFLAQFKEQMDSLTPDDYEDKKSLLQEIVQARVPHGVTYRLLGSRGPDHAPTFESGVFCEDLLLGSGQGRSKKESEMAAATAALKSQAEWLKQIK